MVVSHEYTQAIWLYFEESDLIGSKSTRFKPRSAGFKTVALASELLCFGPSNLVHVRDIEIKLHFKDALAFRIIRDIIWCFVYIWYSYIR